MEVGAIIDFYHVRNIYVEQFFYVILMILTGNLLFFFIHHSYAAIPLLVLAKLSFLRKCFLF